MTTSLTVSFPPERSEHDGALLEPLLPPAKPGGRPRTVDRRLMRTGIFSMLRSGCHGRRLVDGVRLRSRRAGASQRGRGGERRPILLRERVRRQAGRGSAPPRPHAPLGAMRAMRTSQSVTTTERGGSHGSDGAKTRAGRKPHQLVETLGWVLRVLVHPADLPDRASAPWLLQQVHSSLPRLHLIWADSAYVGPLQTWVWEAFGWCPQIVERPGGRGGWLCADQDPPTRWPGLQPAPHRTAGSGSGRSPGSGATGA